ncbi:MULTISPECIES: GcvT family protein [Thalassospira]|jgi:glycine cleavage system aminomethyltransferase T/glycine/D-amino acid oxidase-like deaminating enzyme|uniref:Dehydrogenase n=1 Tax=Thalassospira xiamenensis TaxID=220697 RepID=A0ABR5XVY5_9PROT|nr:MULTISPECIES: FAD-dependent oxidoreductase [Thalassospira]MBL4843272.1 FAD-dependent oxidoreductase [Thalassospira sp.]MBR9780278.1 FAD-dependent oxidoreductase [Rhodospirillales bacterium]KZC96618.1 dehydrogenase [Thalassospira xiamenensis]KZD10534.1 dehydrogenase [Thalassospira xiamenensis]MBR9815504.1 FAD-dependent oxidoreductase [Rhodospirillales bacterium]|tara:strand:- start:5166 stop:7727 length:2562 start_codon:yes stop_codon:yes gene_type:complete|eukprot:TRINITY_DN202_c0_g1_i1.p1 TRINITY_DN202_c0_g1~~TRINITY_DN202_c0_g1_i1.p1  ORF type:complete len:854 (+),score=306.35 TRINITY_DN202_c0_g1_i1:2763-5324(+)
MAAFPNRAKVVIVGVGGIVGASVSHHLIENGWDDIVGIDKSGIPTDIGSTAHASDFCFATSHDLLSCWTTMYSIDFYEKMGHYARIGGIEVARVGDDARMAELKRRVDSGKAFGTNVKIISASEAKEKFPLLEEDQIQGAMWDPDAGLVIPRSQTVAGKLIDQGVESGKLKIFANTSALELITENGRITGVKTERGTIHADYVVVCAGLWGRLIAEMAGEDLPVMPVDHPLTFFGPYNEFAGTGVEIGMPLLRDQGNSAYMRDTGDPKSTEGGQIEWGYYYEENPRLVHPREILEKDQARLSPSQRDLELEDVIEPLERAMELTPILTELGFNESHSFNGLLQTSADGGPSMGESQKLRGLWYAVGIWIKDGPGMGKLIADWMTHGRTHVDHHAIDFARFNEFQLDEKYIYDRCWETAKKIYNPPVHPREPFSKARGIRRSPFYEREVELGGYFMELGGWERAHGYAANEHLLEKYADRVPVRENEWDTRHFWRVSNAEQLAMSDDCGIINLSHFHMTDIEGPDHVELMEWLCAAKVGGDANIGKGIYTHMLDDEGMVRADFTVFRMADRCRLVNGADAGPRDLIYMRRMAQDKGWDVTITDVTEKFTTIGIWGPNARENLKKVVAAPEELDIENFPFAAIRQISIAGKTVTAFRISYVGEQGWELHMRYEDGLAVWDALRGIGVMAVGVETYANSRRLEKSLRLQNADLHTQYNLIEAALARPKVKEADFRGKAKHVEYRERDHQPAMLCTLVMTDNIDANGVARYPVGNLPVMDPDTGKTLIDELGRRSYTTSIAFGPSIGKNIALAYLPWDYCQEGRKLTVSYFDEIYPVEVVGIGYKPLYDPENLKPRS